VVREQCSDLLLQPPPADETAVHVTWARRAVEVAVSVQLDEELLGFCRKPRCWVGDAPRARAFYWLLLLENVLSPLVRFAGGRHPRFRLSFRSIQNTLHSAIAHAGSFKRSDNTHLHSSARGRRAASGQRGPYAPGGTSPIAPMTVCVCKQRSIRTTRFN